MSVKKNIKGGEQFLPLDCKAKARRNLLFFHRHGHVSVYLYLHLYLHPHLCPCIRICIRICECICICTWPAPRSPHSGTPGMPEACEDLLPDLSRVSGRLPDLGAA